MYAILRIQKLKTFGNIGGLNAHLTSEIEPGLDPALLKLNRIIIGSNDLTNDIKVRLKETGVNLRKNAVLAVEHLITTSPEFFQNLNKSKNENGEYFLDADTLTLEKLEGLKNKAIEWLITKYGANNLVNVTLHLHVKTPHIHAIIVPIDNRGRLNSCAFYKGRLNMIQMQDSFAKTMESLGLERGISGKKSNHQTVHKSYNKLESIINDALIQGFRIDLEKGKLVKMTTQEIEQHKLETQIN